VNDNSVGARVRNVSARAACTLVFAAIAISVCSAVYAATAHGRVLGFMPFSSGTTEMFFIKMEIIQNAPQTPACNTTERFTMTSTNTRYKQTFAAILSAYHAESPVRVYGAGTCNNWSNAEDIAYICVGDISC
jgi:hypothetical protein